MGLDNGLVCKNIKRNEIPSWVKPPFDWRDEEEIQLVYFRKCWGIRGEILAKLHCMELNDSETPVEAEDVLPIVKILMQYSDEKYYDENADSIWEYEDYKDNIQQSIINLLWLKMYMESHPEVTAYFYDSY